MAFGKPLLSSHVGYITIHEPESHIQFGHVSHFFRQCVLSTVALMVQCCVRRRLSVTLCIVAKRCVLEKSYYWQPTGSRIWEIDWYQNECPWPLFRGRNRVMSTIAVHSTLNISETVRDHRGQTWFQRTTNRNWSRDRWRRMTPKGAVRQYGRLS